MSFNRFSKRVLAVLLTVALISVMLTVFAFADNLLSVTGTLNEIGSNYISVHVADKDVPFFVTDGTQGSDMAEPGDTLTVYFYASQPDTAVELVRIRIANPPRIDHSHYGVTGTITDITMNTVTVLTKGKYRSFAKDEAQLEGVYDGLLLGDIIEVSYHRDDPQVAVKITMVAHGSNHAQTHQVTHYGVTGTVTDATMNGITILSTSGTYRSFGKDDNMKLVGVRDGISLGDVVKIVYAKSDPQIAIQITMVKQGDNH